MELIELLGDSPAFFIGTCLVFGLLVGSFLNVVIYRLPIMLERQWAEEAAQTTAAADPTATERSAGESPAASPPAPTPVTGPERFDLVVPRSACPKCKAPITALQNIPVLSYLFLKGRCAGCGTRISPRYPAIEALSGVLSAAVAWKFGFGWPALEGLVLTWFLIALTFIDVDHQLLPDDLTLPLLWLGLALSLTVPLGGSPASIPQDPRSAIIGAMAGYLSLWSVYHLFKLLTGQEGMGYGDFKLFAAFGAWLGWKMLFPIILIAAAVGAVVGLVMIMVYGRDRRSHIPFGPFLAAAGWLMLMFGRELVSSYLSLYSLRP
jgi:leader peptidase (prepilin peptidase)/N-methyltransferase